jgi:hypothetical protein
MFFIFLYNKCIENLEEKRTVERLRCVGTGDYNMERDL